ncbi:secretin receptor isoform X2 [Poecilia formosa]|uniref:secretin receptor isoform X2 n=1 Tax=Poecilia formosa TaxID=48698 RepID=UPI0007B9FBC9|nr:PREDICTED: pituitary adenylate cyclase-activating polypeptide type I receptor-like isoform X2 [Poecilia formosa]
MGILAEKGNMMKKVGLIGLLLLHQARSSPGCTPHVDPMKEEEKCMKSLILVREQKAKVNSSVYCKGMWEDMHCWPPASLGETVSLPCLDIFGRVSKGEVHSNCTSNGWTGLLSLHEDACSYAFNDSLKYLEHDSASHWFFSYVKTMYTIGYTLSLITLTIAITIFCFFRKLHCTRNYIHIQLFVSFILRAIFIFIRDGLLFTDSEGYDCDRSTVACKIVLMFCNYFILANYSWLLVEGHFLFTLVSRSFFSLKKHLAWSILLSWGVPFIIIVCWGCAKYFFEDEGCWERRKHEWIWWILRVPVLLSICVNLIFFLGILRILISKLRMSDAHRSEFSQYIISVFKIWTSAELALSSIQGFVVAVLYCFMNGEVQQEFKRRWKRWKLTRHLPSRSRQHHGSISQIGSPHTQVSLLPSSPVSLTNTGFPADTLEM